MRLCPTRKPKKRENEWVGTHSKGQKKLNRVGLHPLVRIKLFQSSGEENRVKIKKVYFHSQNLQYMQNLQRECSHSFLKKAAFRVGLYPLENRKNVKTSGLVPTRNNKKSLIEWGHTPTSMPTAGNPPSRSAVVYLSNISAELLRLSLSGGADRPLSFHYPLHLPLIGGGLPPSAPARYPPASNRLRPGANAVPRPGGRQLLCGDARISLIFFA